MSDCLLSELYVTKRLHIVVFELYAAKRACILLFYNGLIWRGRVEARLNI
jgi:hypothetical protein